MLRRVREPRSVRISSVARELWYPTPPASSRGSGPHRLSFAGGSPSQTSQFAFGVPSRTSRNKTPEAGRLWRWNRISSQGERPARHPVCASSLAWNLALPTWDSSSIGFVCAHRLTLVPLAPAQPDGWQRQAQACRWSSVPIRARLASFVQARGPPGTPISGSASWQELGLFVRNPWPISLRRRSNRRRRRIGFVLRPPCASPIHHNPFSAKHLSLPDLRGELALFRTIAPRLFVGWASRPTSSVSGEAPGTREEGPSPLAPPASSHPIPSGNWLCLYGSPSPLGTPIPRSAGWQRNWVCLHNPQSAIQNRQSKNWLCSAGVL